MRVDTAGVAGPTPAASDYAYRVLAEHLPDVAIFVFDRDLRVEVATGAGMRESAGASRRSSAVPCLSCSRPSGPSC